ncbi:MAG TPA: MFS transporter [Actinomycetota bacterium]|nr:MFS transporter [Actinomycetota bacterium]
MGVLQKSFKLLFGNRDFGALMGTQWLAQAGDGLVQGALAAVIAFGGQKGFDPESAKSPDEVLRIILYTLIPYTVLSPFLGVLIDRWDRRRLLFFANGIRAVVVALVALVGTGRAGELALFLAFLLTLMSTRVVLATKSAALPTTLGDTGLVEGNSLSQLGGALFQLGGLGIALVGKAVLSAEPIMLAGAVVYAAGALLPLRIKHAGEPRPKSTWARELAGVVSSIVAGMREVARVPQAGAAITTYFWLRFLWSFTLVGVGFIAQDLLAGDDLKIAVLTGGAGAIGAALGFLLAPKLTERVRTKGLLVLGAATVAGSAVVIFGGIEKVVTMPLLTFFLGFGFFLGKISLDTMVQEALGDDFRGRAFSLYDIAYNLAWVLAAAILKVMWSDDRRGVLIAGMGVVFLAGIGGLAAWYKRAGLLTKPNEPAPVESVSGSR